MMEQPNRGKRSVGIDLATAGGRAPLPHGRAADVFLTSFLPDARQKLQIDVEHLRAINPHIVYARGTGRARGARGDQGGYDGASFWARGGLGEALSGGIERASRASASGRPSATAIGGMTIAGGIAAALLKRERTGEAPSSTSRCSARPAGRWRPTSPPSRYINMKGGKMDRTQSPNPVVNPYQTQDDRWIMILLLQADRYWADFCRHIERPDLIEDERFVDMKNRFEHRAECVRTLDEVFGSRTLDEWRGRLATMEGVWAPFQTPRELHDDVQVHSNGYLPEVQDAEGKRFRLVANPVQFDETPPELRPAPEHGDHTEEVLLEMGLVLGTDRAGQAERSWEQIAQASGADRFSSASKARNEPRESRHREAADARDDRRGTDTPPGWQRGAFPASSP